MRKNRNHFTMQTRFVSHILECMSNVMCLLCLEAKQLRRRGQTTVGLSLINMSFLELVLHPHSSSYIRYPLQCRCVVMNEASRVRCVASRRVEFSRGRRWGNPLSARSSDIMRSGIPALLTCLPRTRLSQTGNVTTSRPKMEEHLIPKLHTGELRQPAGTGKEHLKPLLTVVVGQGVIIDIFSYLDTSQHNIKVSLEFIEQCKHAERWLISFASSINRLKRLMQHCSVSEV